MLSIQQLEQFNQQQLANLHAIPSPNGRVKRVIHSELGLQPVGKLRRVQPFANVLLAACDFNALPQEMACPESLASSINTMHDFSQIYDQEASDVIVRNGKTLANLASPQLDGYYSENDRSYYPGTVPLVGWGDMVADIHTHPPGRQLARDIKASVINEDEIKARLDYPSKNNLATLLMTSDDPVYRNKQSLLITGSFNTWLLARTQQSPEKQEIGKKQDTIKKLFDYLYSEFPMDFHKDFYEQMHANMQHFAEVFKIAIYKMPFRDGVCSANWQLFQPSI